MKPLSHAIPIAIISFAAAMAVMIGVRMDGATLGLIGASVSGFLAGGLLIGGLAYLVGKRANDAPRAAPSAPQIQWVVPPQPWMQPNFAPPPSQQQLPASPFEQLEPRRYYVIGDEDS